MKLAVSTYSLNKSHTTGLEYLSYDQIIKTLPDLGVQGIEFSGLDDKAKKVGPLKRAAQLRKACDKVGLAIVGYCTSANLLLGPKKQKAEIRRLKEEVDVAVQLGVPSMRHDVCWGWEKTKGVRGPKTMARALAVVVPGIREVADHAMQLGIKTSLENHGFYLQAPDTIEKLIKKVDHKNFGLTMDMGNFLCVNSDPVKAVKQLYPYAVHVHIKDFHIKPKKNAPKQYWIHTPTAIALRGSIVGHGDIDIPAQLQFLKKKKYKGYLSLEFEGIEDPAFAVKEGLAYIRQYL